jgi:hypothetical protein
MVVLQGLPIGQHLYWARFRSSLLAIFQNNCLYSIENSPEKTIVLNEIVFTDWDEIYDDSLEFLLNYHSIQKTEDLSKKVDCGFNKETKIKIIDGEKKIDKLFIGEVLSTGGIVYGIVELTNNLGNEKLYNLLVSNEKFEIADVLHSDYNNNIDSILKLKKNII